ncbi:MAG: hypothetical protein JWL90_3311 [Chthoniobacteraceae bacterium]|nr:hypothetical protein [Chthoniobacteraceae bacterium]
MSSDSIHAELAKFVEALAEDEDLRAWFESLAELGPHQRGEAFRKIALQMRAAGEHPELIQATELLAEETIYQGVRRTLAEAA